MNERIRELMVQADYPAPEIALRAQRLAESIVRECIRKVELRKQFAIEDDHTVEDGFDLLVYDLQSYFGVEL